VDVDARFQCRNGKSGSHLEQQPEIEHQTRPQFFAPRQCADPKTEGRPSNQSRCRNVRCLPSALERCECDACPLHEIESCSEEQSQPAEPRDSLLHEIARQPIAVGGFIAARDADPAGVIRAGHDCTCFLCSR